VHLLLLLLPFVFRRWSFAGTCWNVWPKWTQGALGSIWGLCTATTVSVIHLQVVKHRIYECV